VAKVQNKARRPPGTLVAGAGDDLSFLNTRDGGSDEPDAAGSIHLDPQPPNFTNDSGFAVHEIPPVEMPAETGQGVKHPGHTVYLPINDMFTCCGWLDTVTTLVGGLIEAAGTAYPAAGNAAQVGSSAMNALPDRITIRWRNDPNFSHVNLGSVRAVQYKWLPGPGAPSWYWLNPDAHNGQYYRH
jgi:hypothetical protein